jgi:hypothetical protein
MLTTEALTFAAGDLVELAEPVAHCRGIAVVLHDPCATSAEGATMMGSRLGWCRGGASGRLASAGSPGLGVDV